MRFLITNDDGILAHGIECLAEAAQPLGEVFVVAPDREQSATSHSLTLHHPLRPGAARRAAMAGGRHADRLRDAGGGGAAATSVPTSC